MSLPNLICGIDRHKTKHNCSLPPDEALGVVDGAHGVDCQPLQGLFAHQHLALQMHIYVCRRAMDVCCKQDKTRWLA